MLENSSKSCYFLRNFYAILAQLVEYLHDMQGVTGSSPVGRTNFFGENSMQDNIPVQPPKSFRVVIELNARVSRMDTTLLNALKAQRENLNLRIITRQGLKNLFLEGRVQIKGQRARPSSAMAAGTTYVDILGY